MPAFLYLINFLLYFFLWVKHKNRFNLDIYGFTILFYSVIALSSLLYILNFDDSIQKCNFFPLIYLFVCFTISISPIKCFSSFSVKSISKPDDLWLNFIITFIIVSAFVRIPSIINNFSLVIRQALIDSNFFYDLYNDNMSAYTTIQQNDGFNYLTIVLRMLDRYIPFFLFYYFTKPNLKIWVLVSLILSSLISPISGLVNAQRGTLFTSLLSFLVAYFIFKDFLNAKIQKTVRVLGSIILMAIIGMLAVITISRFSQDYMAEDSVLRSVFSYSGQPMRNFDMYGFDTGGIRYGDRTAPLIKAMLFIDGSYDYPARMLTYSHLHLNESVFSTYIGDLVVDFGVFFAFLIIVIIRFAFLSMIKIRNESVSVSSLFAVYLLSYLIVCGWTLFPFADLGGNLHLVVGVIIYFLLKKSSNNGIVNISKGKKMSLPDLGGSSAI